MGGSSECAKQVEAHREKDENREIQHISGSVESSKMRLATKSCMVSLIEMICDGPQNNGDKNGP
jgi:hypothetical protein